MFQRFYRFSLFAGLIFTLCMSAPLPSDACPDAFDDGSTGGSFLPDETPLPGLNTNVGGLKQHILPHFVTALAQYATKRDQAKLYSMVSYMVTLGDYLDSHSSGYDANLHYTLHVSHPREVVLIQSSLEHIQAILVIIRDGGRPVDFVAIAKHIDAIEQNRDQILEEATTAPSVAVSKPNGEPLGSDAIKTRILLSAKDASGNPGANSIYSHSSLSSAMSLVGLGYDAPTVALLEELIGRSPEKVLRSSAQYSIDQPGIRVLSANNIWSLPEFRVKQDYLGELDVLMDGLKPRPLDISDPDGTAREINDWIGTRTENLLGEVVKPDMITGDLVMMLVNALYFKGTWLETFDKTLTERAPFAAVTVEGKPVQGAQANLMQKFGTNQQVSISDARQLGDGKLVQIRLPYEGDRFAMYVSFVARPTGDQDRFQPAVFQPDPTVDITSVYELANKLLDKGTADFGEMDLERLALPKFKTTSTYDLRETLEAAGYGQLFEPGRLTRMTDDPRAYLAFLIQKATIEVNEEGSEAAAVTVGGVGLESLRAPDPSVVVDGPFAYSIRDDQTNEALFEGVIRNIPE